MPLLSAARPPDPDRAPGAHQQEGRPAALHADHRRQRERTRRQAGASTKWRRCTTRSPWSRRTSCSTPTTARSTASTRRRRSSCSATAPTRASASTARNTGYEFVSLVEAVLLAGTGNLELEPETVAALAAVDTSRCTSRCSRPRLDRTVPGRSSWLTRWPTPTRTSRPMRSTRRNSWSCRGATASPGVPKTIVNDTIEILGGLPEADFVDAVLQRPDAPSYAS